MNVIKRLKRRYNKRFPKIYHLGFHLNMNGMWHREVACFPPHFYQERRVILGDFSINGGSEIRILTGLNK